MSRALVTFFDLGAGIFSTGLKRVLIASTTVDLATSAAVATWEKLEQKN